MGRRWQGTQSRLRRLAIPSISMHCEETDFPPDLRRPRESGRAVLAVGFRKSSRLDFFHTMPKGRSFPDDGQIVHVLQQYFIRGNDQENGDFPPFVVGQELDVHTRAHKLACGRVQFKSVRWSLHPPPSSSKVRRECVPSENREAPSAFCRHDALKWSERQDLNLSTRPNNQEVTSGDTQRDTQNAVAPLHDLSQVVTAWPRLSAPLKAAILAIVRTVMES